MTLTGKIDDSKLKLALEELNTWCMNYQGNVGMVFSEQVTIEKKIVKLFWCVKQALDQGVALTDGYNELYDYVNNYFANLDIQEEIDKKLEEMVEDGTLEQIINQEIFGKLNSKIDALNTFTNDLIEGGKKIMFVGDSIAAGFGWWIDGTLQSDRPGKEGIMSVLQEKFPNNAYTNLARNGACLGRNGNTSNAIFHQTFTTEQDYLIIICGINDITTMNGSVDTMGNYDNYLEAITTLDWYTAYGALYSYLRWASQTYPNMKVIFMTEPSTEYNYFKYLAAIEQYKTICSLFGVYVVDMYNFFPKFTVSVKNNYYYDRVHPNEAGYRLMTDIFIKSMNGEPIQKFESLFNNKLLVMYSDALNALPSVTGHINYQVYLKDLTKDLCSTLGDRYYNDDIILNGGGDYFIVCHVNHVYQEVWNVTFYPPSANRLSYSFNYYQGGVLEICDGLISPGSPLNDIYGVTKISDIPKSGVYYGAIGNFTDLPSAWTKTLLCTIIAHVNINVGYDSGWTGYKWIEVVPYGSTERFYCRFIRNVPNGPSLIDYFTDTSLQPYKDN